MKNTNGFKLFGFIALIAVIGFSMAACGGDDDGDGGGGGNGSQSSTLKITNAQVYSMDEDDQLTTFTGTVQDLNHVYRGSEELESLNDLINGTPTVTLKNGKLNVTLGTPKTSSLQDLTSGMPSGITVSTTGVKIFSVSSFYNSNGYTNVFQERLTNDQASYEVNYTYSNKDVNISGTSTPYGSFTMTYAMNLKAGWNSIIITYNQTGGTIKTGTPSADYKWVIRNQ